MIFSRKCDQFVFALKGQYAKDKEVVLHYVFLIKCLKRFLTDFFLFLLLQISQQKYENVYKVNSP